MHFDSAILGVATGAAGLLLFAGLLIKDPVPRATPDGMVFRSRPLLASAGMLVAPLIILSFASIMGANKRLILWTDMLVVCVAVFVGLMRMPGTINLTP